jgi:Uma2 family endonuclease
MLAETALSPRELADVWQQLSQDETLPDRYELTQHGEVVMSPKPTNRHQLICSEIADQLKQQLGGRAVVEAAVLTTTAGVRVPDVVWMPTPRWAVVLTGSGLLEAPELVVEVLSPGNRRGEVAHKVRAYLDAGITEVIVVALDGTLSFHHADGQHAASALGVVLDLPAELFG